MSKYVVSARKYRPQKFSEVVGQQHIVGTLANALRTDHLAHSFLFCGPRGVGKTTTARILARTLNCTNVQNGVDPCGECESCKSFQRNASFSIFELDAASNNSVEHIRMLNDQVRVPPSDGRYKVYIIDEVHMLSSAAFNAFLKTLEEPPSYAIFILATTEKHKILPTILSRCQIFDFKRIMVDEMVGHLQHIAEAENITVERDALAVIAQKSDGALRDALSLFDRLASVSQGEITYKTVVENLNILDYDIFFRVVDACIREDVRDALLIFADVLENGFEGDAFLNGLASHFRDLLVCKDPKTHTLMHHSETLMQRYIDQARPLTMAYIFSALSLINEADVSYLRATNKRLHVEVALSKLCYINRAIEVVPFAAEKKTPDTTIPAAHPVVEAKPAPVRQPETKAEQPARKKEESVESKPVEVQPTTPTRVVKAKRSKVGTSSSIPKLASLDSIVEEIKREEQEARANRLELTIENLQNSWNTYRDELSSQSVITTFNATKLGLDGKTVILEVPSDMARTRIQQEKQLLTKLRTDFHDPELQIKFEVNETEPASQSKKPRSTKEKYDHLVTKNPSLKSLKDTLELGVDDV